MVVYLPVTIDQLKAHDRLTDKTQSRPVPCTSVETILCASCEGSASKANPSSSNALMTSRTLVPLLTVSCLLSRSLRTTPQYRSSDTKTSSVTIPLLNECPGTKNPDAFGLLHEVDYLGLRGWLNEPRRFIAKPLGPVPKLAATHPALEPQIVSQRDSV